MGSVSEDEVKYRIVMEKSVEDDIRRLDNGQQRFFHMLLKRIGEKMVTHIQKNKLTGQVLNIRSGDLRTKMYSDMVGNATVEVGNAAKYAGIHEFGGDIYPKRAKALVFNVGGRWVRTKHVRIPARPYIKPGVEEFLGGAQARSIFDGMFEKYKRQEGWM